MCAKNVGAPDEDVNGTVTHVDAGAVFVFRGTSNGLVPDGIIVQGQDGVPESPEDDDRFGAAISQGPTVDGGSSTDCPPGADEDMTLMIGAPGEGLGVFDNGDGVVLRIVLPCSGTSDVGQLPRAAILHWEFAHFVVLDRVTKRGIEIVDPAAGRRVVSREAFSRSFTGVAVVVEPGESFQLVSPGRGKLWGYFRKLFAQSRLIGRVVVTSILLRLFALALPLLAALRGNRGRR